MVELLLKDAAACMLGLIKFPRPSMVDATAEETTEDDLDALDATCVDMPFLMASLIDLSSMPNLSKAF